jgi:uncharacterized protein YgbK (DUF1537 family)
VSGARPSRLLYTYYGDDFTGSTDVLEALALHGVPAVLFTSVPTAADLAAFPHCRAVGIAGESRSRSPRWMDAHLPPIFARMRALGAAVNQYKVCSTFDSSPHTGSIGHAMELGRKAFRTHFVPIVVGAPHLCRAVVYGNLFAVAKGAMVRIDRHPTMQRHPVTPMHEADLRLHLARQTRLNIGLVDLRAFERGGAAEQLQTELAAGAQAVLFDGINDSMLDQTADLVSNLAARKPIFAVGSSGLTYGLLRQWRRAGLVPRYTRLAAAQPTDRVLVLSGSCSPVTAAQIRHARQHGFAAWRLGKPDIWPLRRKQALKVLAEGRSVVLYTSLGPLPAKTQTIDALPVALGHLLREIVTRSDVRRVILAGGDTSTHAVQQLGLRALTFAAPLTPGAPLCRGHASDSPLDGLELVLKGGQIGPENFFSAVRNGA